MSEPRSLYITLQYLRTESNGQNKYHWGLYATDDSPPKGTLFHATDVGRQALDLYYEMRNVSNPLRSQSLVSCLKIGQAASSTAIHRCVSTVPLMSKSRMPADERQWTCRVYVKEALNALHRDGILRLPASVDSIERACLAVADSYLPYRKTLQRPRLLNDLAWMTSSTSRTAPMEIDSTPYYPSQMEVGSSGRYRSYGSEMEIDSSAGHTVPQY